LKYAITWIASWIASSLQPWPRSASTSACSAEDETSVSLTAKSQSARTDGVRSARR
jgi:hypothetical protein